MTLCEQCELKDVCEIRCNHDADDERAMTYCMDMKPTRCVDPVVKYCQGCRFGHCIYPEWVETAEDLEWCSFETVCMYGFDKGRPEDEPTEEELKEFEEWLNQSYFITQENDKNDKEDTFTQNKCAGCVYEDADGSTEDIGYCVCCNRIIDAAKNDYYRKK